MRILLKVISAVLSAIYGMIKLVTPVKNKVTLLSRQGDKPSLDFLLLTRQMEKQMADTQIVVLCKTLTKRPLKVIGYAFHMMVQMYHIATSKVIILDSYCIAASLLKHKVSLTIIQMWHSMGTMKKFGYTALDKNEGSGYQLAEGMKMHHNYDYFFASSIAYVDHLAAGFHCPSTKAIIKPLPRLDLLTDETHREKRKLEIFSRYPQLNQAERKNILYCPTFRKAEEGMQKAVDQITAAVDYSRYNLIVKLHPLSKISVSKGQVVVPDDYATFDMLFIADYVISDYSCVIYEAAVLNIPLHFFCFDIEAYTGVRGLAIDYEKECPGVISKDIEPILQAIEEVRYDMDYLRAFTNKYITLTPHASLDIVNFVLPLIK